MGVLLGGISAVSRNVFWNHEGKESAAINTVYKVYLVRTDAKQKELKQSTNPFSMEIFEDPKALRLYFEFSLPEVDKITLQIFDKNGNEVMHTA